jgi:hypothetical protein
MIQFTSIIRSTDGSWTFNWNATTGSYRIVLWGEELATVSVTSYNYRNPTYKDFPPPLEVVDYGLALSEENEPYLVMQWYGEPQASNYLIQQSKDNGATWGNIGSLEENGQWIYTFRTGILVDRTKYQYRVIAVDNVDNQSPARYYTKYIVCPPIPPDSTVSVTYNKPNIVIQGNA